MMEFVVAWPSETKVIGRESRLTPKVRVTENCGKIVVGTLEGTTLKPAELRLRSRRRQHINQLLEVNPASGIRSDRFAQPDGLSQK